MWKQQKVVNWYKTEYGSQLNEANGSVETQTQTLLQPKVHKNDNRIVGRPNLSKDSIPV